MPHAARVAVTFVVIFAGFVGSMMALAWGLS